MTGQIYLLTLIFLSLIDACFTIMLVKHGSVEVNPLMAFFLKQGLLWFIIVKICIPFIGGSYLMIHIYDQLFFFST